MTAAPSAPETPREYPHHAEPNLRHSPTASNKTSSSTSAPSTASPAANVYGMVLRQVEKPMLEVVMAQCGGNQSKAADMLGINRNTLRKKLTEHGLL